MKRTSFVQFAKNSDVRINYGKIIFL